MLDLTDEGLPLVSHILTIEKDVTQSFNINSTTTYQIYSIGSPI